MSRRRIFETALHGIRDADLQSLLWRHRSRRTAQFFCHSNLTERKTNSSPWLGPAWCFEFSRADVRAPQEPPARRSRFPRSQTTKEKSSCRTIGTYTPQPPRRREVLIQKIQLPTPPLFRAADGIYRSGEIYQDANFAVGGWSLSRTNFSRRGEALPRLRTAHID